MAWLCVALLMLIGFARPLVLCTPEHGATHIEFAHEEGDCCSLPGELPAPTGGDSLRADPICEHVDLAIDVAPSPQPDGMGQQDEPDATTPFEPECAPRNGVETARLHPTARRPPRPTRLLAERRTIVLQL